MHLLVVLLRALHVVLGVFWAGALFFVVVFLDPSVQATGPDGGRVMQALQRRRYLEFMLLFAALTLLSGLTMYWQLSGGFSRPWMLSRYGLSLTIGGITGLGAFAIGLFVSRPTLRRIDALAATMAGTSEPPQATHLAEIQRLRDRLRTAARVVAGLLLVSILSMALARFL